MDLVSKAVLTEQAAGFRAKGQTWHYHLLTPNCQFNEVGKFALLLEGVDTHESFAHYSDEAEMELSKSLATILHGDEVMSQSQLSQDYEPTKEVRAILDLINELSALGVKWHHHVFFPGCIFNSHPTKYELVLEDPRNSGRLVSISDDEPKEALKQIEAQFYSQK